MVGLNCYRVFYYMEYYKYFDRRFFYVGLVIVVVGDIFGVMERKKNNDKFSCFKL